ncbi:hypothetical protein CEV32_4834 [Brucella rhizosphaerae]|uniref:Uncharacterized protein n=1 Tax=Brucella rhizosphaerae TaxID=571254 RepID=A0A256FLA8_9HYPH|nr:hypothetical protein CEV32_4834 [Brucella rhizosphaerae]
MTLGLLSGCATSGNYCNMARAIYASHYDTSETKRQILAENEKMEKLCGVRP